MPDLRKLDELIKPSKTDDGDGMSLEIYLYIGEIILTA